MGGIQHEEKRIDWHDIGTVCRDMAVSDDDCPMSHMGIREVWDPNGLPQSLDGAGKKFQPSDSRYLS